MAKFGNIVLFSTCKYVFTGLSSLLSTRDVNILTEQRMKGPSLFIRAQLFTQHNMGGVVVFNKLPEHLGHEQSWQEGFSSSRLLLGGKIYSELR